MAERPNVLFIVADDLNAWIGPLGRHPDVRTPEIDRLAQGATVFTHSYCTAPYCNASRMSVFTACLPETTGVYHNEPFWEQPLRRPTFLEQFREQGYYCFGAGKVFHGTFDYATAGRTRAREAAWRDTENRPGFWDDFVVNQAEPMPPSRPLNRMFDFDNFDQVSTWNHLFDWGVLPADREAETPDGRTVEAIERFLRAPPRQPFFCAAGLYKPHLPWYAPQRFFDLYPLESVALPFVKADDLDDVPEIARKWALHPPDHETVLRHGQWRHAVQGYLAAISYCDSLIGRILAALQASPAADDTIVVLWGDNGFHLGEKLHWRKFVLWEEATRVPFIVAPPKGSATRARVDAPVSLIDLFPTLCDLTGVRPIEEVDGVSLVPLMNGTADAREKPVVTTWQKGNHSLRVGQWRYTRYHDGSEELYDHASDPYEWTNLAREPRFTEVLSMFRPQVTAGRPDPESGRPAEMAAERPAVARSPGQEFGLNIGAGQTYIPGMVNVDIAPYADVAIDLNRDRLPFADGTVDFIFTYHTLEHLDAYLFALSEIHRVLRHGGRLFVGVPYVTLTEYNLINPYHRQNFSECSFDFFEPGKLLGSAAEGATVRFKKVFHRFHYLPEFEGKSERRKEWCRRHLMNVVQKIDFGLVAMKADQPAIEIDSSAPPRFLAEFDALLGRRTGYTQEMLKRGGQRR